MGYVADRWHKTRPKPGEPECGQHKGMVAAAAHGKGKRWQARYDDPNGKEVTSLWATKVEAEREINKQEAAKQSGSWLDPKAGRVTVERFARDTWLPAQSINGRSENEYEGALRRYLFPSGGTGRSVRSSPARPGRGRSSSSPSTSYRAATPTGSRGTSAVCSVSPSSTA
ncbi:hypothetical protein NEH16_07675 [Streptomyces drozdowiczii]|uniref:Integrase n=1 Tax=Streptomyces drozdowiczii TaxID=202862 RepID=A0ABY6PPZ0_9ACTN|nr:hypothetical protein [Streptomyces drozdowiczii]UZK54044.1 hypothetical protein NEH16_07675 [Streptomyces drozdowiczii]